MPVTRCPVCGERSELLPGPGRLGKGTRHLDCVHRHAMTTPFDEWLDAYARQIQTELDEWLHPADRPVDHDHAWDLREARGGLVVLECEDCGALSVDQ